MRTSLALALSLGLSLAACKRARPRDAAPEATAATAAAAAAPAAPQPPPSPEMRTLSGRLAFEAAHRPTGTARVEDVVAALGRAGVALAEPKQYLAATAAASYCAGGHTADGLAVSVCEYADAAAATAGRAHVERRFAALAADRRIVVRGATTLTTTAPPGAAPATRAAAEQAFLAL
ncbi:MAG: hypothetical protein IPH80_19190 [Myxococcales bacterium]|nr:hypothetical protein [Myxococcales bacterium]